MATPQSDTTRKIIEDAIMGFAPLVSLDSKISFDEVRSTIRVFIRKHPEIFWFSHQYRYDEKTGILRFKYNFTKEKADFFKGEIEKVVNDDFQIDYVKSLSEIERLVYVYKWIANRTTYNEYSSFNQTIYSVLVNRNSVCTGYAKTAQYLLGLVGIESELVFGKFHSDKSEHGRHGWNIVKINGKWYHIDFCLADETLSYLLNKDESPNENNSILWNYFGVSTDKILSNRSIEFIETLPECKDTLADYPNVELRKPRKQLICCKSDSGTSSMIYIDSFNKNRVIKVSRDGKTGLLDYEAAILSKLSGCQHIIKSYGLCDNGLSLEQLTPWSELLNSHYYNPTESDLRNILCQLIEGLIECKDRGISYSDIHYNNVFVAKDETYKWGDFGIAFRYRSSGKLPSQMIGDDGKAKGSYWFMAPETYHQNIFNQSSAIYSVAMMAYFVMNDMRPPFWSDENYKEEALDNRLNGNVIPKPIFSDNFKHLWPILRLILNDRNDYTKLNFDDFLLIMDNVEYYDESNSSLNIGLLFANREPLKRLISGTKITLKLQRKSVCDTHNNSTISRPKGRLAGGSYLLQNSNVSDSDEFATTMGGRWGDGGIHDSDSFACTAAFPGNSFHQPSEPYESYQPQKKSPLKAIKKKTTSWLCNFWKKYDSSANTEVEYDYGNNINACVYAPAQIQPMKTFIVRVYLYKPEESEIVDTKVKDIDSNAQKKEYKPLDIPVKEGDKLSVQLKMSKGIEPGIEEKSITWRNHFTDCSFRAKLTDPSVDDVFGTAYISVNDIPAGELLFTIDVVYQEEKTLYAKVKSRRYSRIFISYSHADEIQVRGFAECCRAIGTDYFFDRHTLHAGDVFKEKILEYINNADLFVLCWSKNAAESEWVKIEREHALSLIKEGKAKLAIYPLSLKPEAPLPADMSDKFNFATL